MLSKKEVLKSLRSLPEKFSVDDVIDRLIVLHKMNRGRQEIKAGKGFSTEAAKKKLKKWLN